MFLKLLSKVFYEIWIFKKAESAMLTTGDCSKKLKSIMHFNAASSLTLGKHRPLLLIYFVCIDLQSSVFNYNA